MKILPTLFILSWSMLVFFAQAADMKNANEIITKANLATCVFVHAGLGLATSVHGDDFTTA